jgi:hypothetical protein
VTTSEAHTRANRTWRERTGLKLVQAYLHTDIVERLDSLVSERKATGRAAVLAELIEGGFSDSSAPTQVNVIRTMEAEGAPRSDILGFKTLRGAEWTAPRLTAWIHRHR